jgi:protein tyrosine phosphatase (PTP) superfamily phosphohydrolase (DUF442 family)
MRVRLSKFIAVAIAIVCLAGTGVAQSEAGYKGLPKFHKVNAGLYRGAQPKSEGLRRLAELGIKTVVDLRRAGDRARAKEREAHALGLRYYNVPLKWYGRPKDEQVKRVLEIINAPENQPVFVHCAHGVDRTGLIVAVYRIAQDGWTSAQAKREAKRFGMHWWKFGLKNYIRDYYKRLSRGTGETLTPSVVYGHRAAQQ